MTGPIETDRLTRRFGAVTGVDRLDLTVRPQEMFALPGPNGAGKTTAIKMPITLLPPPLLVLLTIAARLYPRLAQ